MSLNLYLKGCNMKTLRQRRRDRRRAVVRFMLTFVGCWSLAYVLVSLVAFNKHNPTVPFIDYHYHLRDILLWNKL